LLNFVLGENFDALYFNSIRGTVRSIELMLRLLLMYRRMLEAHKTLEKCICDVRSGDAFDMRQVEIVRYAASKNFVDRLSRAKTQLQWAFTSLQELVLELRRQVDKDCDYALQKINVGLLQKQKLHVDVYTILEKVEFDSDTEMEHQTQEKAKKSKRRGRVCQKEIVSSSSVQQQFIAPPPPPPPILPPWWYFQQQQQPQPQQELPFHQQLMQIYVPPSYQFYQ